MAVSNGSAAPGVQGAGENEGGMALSLGGRVDFWTKHGGIGLLVEDDRGEFTALALTADEAFELGGALLARGELMKARDRAV